MSSSSDDLATVRALESRRYEAMVAGDIATLDALCMAEAVYTHSNAERDTKESYLDKVRAGYYEYHTISHEEERIILSGDCAVIVGSMRAEVTISGELRHLENSALAVWSKASGDWHLVAYQSTPYPAP